MTAEMIPAGYLYKRVAERPPWIAKARHIAEIQSVSSCVSEDFADYVQHWQHNGFWLFDSPELMIAIALSKNVDFRPLTLFYYEIYPLEFEEAARSWSAVLPDGPIHVVPPSAKVFSGYDVSSFSQRNRPECSPLSCNQLCEKIPVNQYCLFDTFDAAKDALDSGAFDRTEPGPFRILAVFTVKSVTGP
jgi:hypothetical protein